MDHIAIMKKSWGLIPKILSGQKRIESRWYQTRRAPWDTVRPGDRIFFKNGGEPVIAEAAVRDVSQFEIKTIADARKIIREYGKAICLLHDDPKTWERLPKYCILVFLENARAIEPFEINKKGFGAPAAWLTVADVSKIKR